MRKLTLGMALGVNFGLALLASSAMAQDHSGDRGPLGMLDSDGDGSISFEEFKASDGEHFDNADTDGDGVLSLEEFMASGPRRGERPAGRDISDERAAEIEARMAERAAEQFAQIDANGDNLLSQLEMQEANFLRLDSDNDGMLTGREIRRMARGPQGGPRQDGERRPMQQRWTRGV